MTKLSTEKYTNSMNFQSELEVNMSLPKLRNKKLPYLRLASFFNISGR